MGVSKGACMERILGVMAGEGRGRRGGGRALVLGARRCRTPSTHSPRLAATDCGSLDDIDFVFVAGHFLARDENVFTLFQGRDGAAPSAAPPPPDAGALAALLQGERAGERGACVVRPACLLCAQV